MKSSLTVAIVGIVFVLMLLPTSLNLQTSNAASLITVPTDYPTIQSAIDAASAGDTIKVLPGTYVDGEHTISNTQISGGNVGVLASAFSVDTVATLDRVTIVGTITPTQELSVGATAEVVFAPRSAQSLQIATLTGNPISYVLPTPGLCRLGWLKIF